jgi:phosphohistidine phosphatase
MKLHLIRHAKTDQMSESGKDFDRKLLPKGIIQSNVLGYYLHEQNWSSAVVFCSTAARTMETLTILSNFVFMGKTLLLDELYLCDREMYLKIIWNLHHGKDLVFIGHNDGISQIASYLLEKDITLKTSGYLCIEFTAKNWAEVSRGTGHLVAEFRPQAYFPE